MSCEQANAETLKKSGQRLTPQRLMILTAVRHAGAHVTASDVLAQVKESYPYIDASTVYRTLSVLKNERLVSETDMGAGESVYEWLGQVRHHHLICSSCGGVTLMYDRYLASLSAEILEDYGFQADIDPFAIFGVCKDCRPDPQGS